MYMTNLPKISIESARLLEPYFEPYAKKANFVVPPEEKIPEILKNFSEEWSKFEKTILEGIIQATGLQYSQDEIPVSVAPSLAYYTAGGTLNPGLSASYSLRDGVAVNLGGRLPRDRRRSKALRCREHCVHTFGG